jgi:hypothetical protein
MQHFVIMPKSMWDKMRPSPAKPMRIDAQSVSSTWYPRLVVADDAYEALELCFHPEPLRPGGIRHFVVIPLMVQDAERFTVAPVSNYVIRREGDGS